MSVARLFGGYCCFALAIAIVSVLLSVFRLFVAGAVKSFLFAENCLVLDSFFFFDTLYVAKI